MMHDYHTRCAAIAADVEAAARFRMATCCDYRELYLYVSPTDGGHTVGHAGQHVGMWVSAEAVVTAGTMYEHIVRNVVRLARTAPLYATAAR